MKNIISLTSAFDEGFDYATALKMTEALNGFLPQGSDPWRLPNEHEALRLIKEGVKTPTNFWLVSDANPESRSAGYVDRQDMGYNLTMTEWKNRHLGVLLVRGQYLT